MSSRVATCLVLLAGSLTPAQGQTPGIFSFDTAARSVLRVDAHGCRSDAGETTDREATGFLWRDKNTAVTALHVVAACSSLSVYYQVGKLPRPAYISKVLRRADLVLLTIGDPPNSPPLIDEPQPPPLTEELQTLGFSLHIPDMSSTPLRLRWGGKRLRDIVPSNVAQTLSGTSSPSLDLEITNIEGHLVPGLSGAPVFNKAGRVVAIGDGGLDNGAVGISWGIPSRMLRDLADSPDDTSSSTLAVHNANLFAIESQSSVKGQVNCSGLPLTKLRTARFDQIARSTDDPLGLQQLVNFFNVNPSNFSFDIYQHLPSGATIVVPSAAAISSGSEGCTASFSNGEMVMKIQMSIVANGTDMQSRADQEEVIAAGGAVQGWWADPAFTYRNPVPRFDGMLVRRMAFAHWSQAQFPTGMPLQDRYLFETIATRGEVLIMESVMNNIATPQNYQLAITCRQNPYYGDCASINLKTDDWVRTVIATHLTTFPIG